MNEKETKQNKWLQKLKNVKHIEVYITIIFLAILLLLYFGKESSKVSTSSSSTQIIEDYTIENYVTNLEKDLELSLSNIGGVSNVNVLITLDMEQAEIQDSKVCLTKFPKIKGILITAKGVDDTYTKMKILHAVESVVEVESNKIQILSN